MEFAFELDEDGDRPRSLGIEALGLGELDDQRYGDAARSERRAALKKVEDGELKQGKEAKDEE